MPTKTSPTVPRQSISGSQAADRYPAATATEDVLRARWRASVAEMRARGLDVDPDDAVHEAAATAWLRGDDLREPDDRPRHLRVLG